MPGTGIETSGDFGKLRNAKQVFNLPLGCEVHFEDSVVDIFVDQGLDPARATRYNIGRILLYQYEKLARSLGHEPTKTEVDRSLWLGVPFYKLVFGSWPKFEELVGKEN